MSLSTLPEPVQAGLINAAVAKKAAPPNSEAWLVQQVAAALCAAELVPVQLKLLERAAITNALERFAGNRTHAARSLGISVRTLQRKLKLGGPLDGEANGAED